MRKRPTKPGLGKYRGPAFRRVRGCRRRSGVCERDRYRLAGTTGPAERSAVEPIPPTTWAGSPGDRVSKREKVWPKIHHAAGKYFCRIIIAMMMTTMVMVSATYTMKALNMVVTIMMMVTCSAISLSRHYPNRNPNNPPVSVSSERRCSRTIFSRSMSFARGSRSKMSEFIATIY